MSQLRLGGSVVYSTTTQAWLLAYNQLIFKGFSDTPRRQNPDEMRCTPLCFKRPQRLVSYKLIM